MSADGRLILAGTPWKVWPHFVLRSTGFPLAELTGAISEGAGTGRPPDARTVLPAVELASDERVAAALLWQNPRVLREIIPSLDQWARSPAAGPARSRRERRAERSRRFRMRILGKYLQRYHTRNESVGFFGPVVWGTIGPGPRIVVKSGPGLTDQRHVMFEDWAIDELAAAFAGSPEIRRLLPPALAPGARRMGRRVLSAEGAPRRLSPKEAALLRLVDGARPAREIAARIGGEDEVLGLLAGLADDGIVRWSFDVPVDLAPEAGLERQLRELPPLPAVSAALGVLRALDSARAEVAAADSAPRLARALERADEIYAAAAGRDAHRAFGDGRKGRSLLVGAERRDIRVALGLGVLEELAAPLKLLLESARWFCVRVGEEAIGWCVDAHRTLSELYGEQSVPLDALIAAVSDRLWDPQSCRHIRRELARRWELVLAPALGETAVLRDPAELAAAVAEQFTAPAPSWYTGRHHSPDIQLAAESEQALNDGDFHAVLGELHAGIVTVDYASMTLCCPDPEVAVLRPAEAALDDGPPRFVPLYHRTPQGLTAFDFPPPETYSPRYSYLSFAERAGARPAPGRSVAAADVRVARDGDELVARLPDGDVYPLLTVVGEYLVYQTGTGFNLLAATEHTPRVSIGRLVVSRERWCVPAAEFTGAGQDGPGRPGAEAAGGGALPEETEQNRLHRRVQTVAKERGLPRHSFWRLRPSAKPVYLDLHSPLLVEVLLGELGAAGAEDTVTITEMLPGPDQLWLPDADDRRYTSELRFVFAE